VTYYNDDGILDTRKKIVSLAQVEMNLADGNWLVVAGYFDPLTAFVAERLENLLVQGRNEKVLAVVLDGPGMLLSAEARSVLIAALRIVHLVSVAPEKELHRFVAGDPRIRFVFDRETDQRNSAAFSGLVLSKERLLVHGAELGS
jgi:hypothetical protein